MGTFTWILLHWISQQIKEKYFASERSKLIKIIEDICANLPCPTCREHALSYLKKVPLAHIQTKNDLVNYVYHFHNSVNVRGKKEYQPFTIMEKYKKSEFFVTYGLEYRFVYGNDIQRNDFMAKNRLSTLKKRDKYLFQRKLS